MYLSEFESGYILHSDINCLIFKWIWSLPLKPKKRSDIGANSDNISRVGPLHSYSKSIIGQGWHQQVSSFCEALTKNLTTGFPSLPWIQGYQRYRYTEFSTYIYTHILTPLSTRNHNSKSVEFYENRDIFYFLGPHLYFRVAIFRSLALCMQTMSIQSTCIKRWVNLICLCWEISCTIIVSVFAGIGSLLHCWRI